MRKVVLGDLGQAYFRAVLEGETGLCAVLRGCPLESGTYSTFLPNNGKDYDVTRPQRGGLLHGGEGHSVFSLLTDYLREMMSRLPAARVIVQTPWAERSDIPPRDIEDVLLFEAGLGVCHLSKDNRVDIDEMWFLMHDIVPPKYAGCVLKDNPVVDRAHVRGYTRLRDDILAAFVPAYDDESFVLWERSVSSTLPDG